MSRFSFSFVRSALTPLWTAVLLLLAIAPWTTPRALALTYTSVASGGWGSTSTWDQGAVPPNNEPVVIALGHTVTTDGNREPGDLTINGTLSLGTDIVDFEGTTFTNNGALTASSGDFRFSGVNGASATTQTVAGTGTYALQVHIRNSTTTVPAAGASLNGGSTFTLTIESGATLRLFNVDLSVGGNLTVATGGTLDKYHQSLFFRGTTFTNNGAVISTSCCTPGAAFRFNGVAGASGTTQTLAGAGSYSTGHVDVRIENSTTVAPASGASLDGAKTLTIDPLSTLSLANAFLIKHNPTLGTAVTNNGMISGAGTLKTQGTVTFTSVAWTAPLEVESGTTTGNGNVSAVTIDNGATLKVFNADLSVGGDLTVATGGTLDKHHQSLFFRGTTFTNNGAVISTSCCAWSFRFSGVAGAPGTTQTLAGAGTYNAGPSPVDMLIENSTTVAPASGASLDSVKTLTIDALSTLSLANAFLIKHGGTGTTLTNNGMISGAGTLKTQGTVTFTSAAWTAPLEVESGTTRGTGTVGAVTIDNGATLKLGDADLSVGGDLTVATGGTLDKFHRALFFRGTTFTNNGSLIASSCCLADFQFDGVAGASGTTQHAGASTGTTSVPLFLGNGTTLVLDGSFPLGTFTVQSGTTLTSLASGTLTLSGNLTNSGTVLLNGSGGPCGDAGKILLRSSVAGTQRSWSNGNYSIQDVDVKDQSAATAKIAYGSVNSGNNTNWNFATCPGFYSAAPCRALDTRVSLPALSSGVARAVPIVASGCGVPAEADAVVFNMTVANVSATGSIVAYPDAGSPPRASTISFTAGKTRANNGVLGLAANGNGTFQALATFAGGGTVDLIVDISGYFVDP
jgi:hypothetical protein